MIAENPEADNQEEGRPLDTVVDSIMKRQKQRGAASQPIVSSPTDSYDKIYSNINRILTGFDTSIDDCKKYNEAKIHRKYEIRIADLEQQIKILRDKVEAEQSARDPSKKYVQNLLDQLVRYKDQNIRLKEENARLISLSHETSLRRTDSPVNIRQSSGSQVQVKSKQPSIADEVEAYLASKKLIKRGFVSKTSKLQHFLRRNLPKIQSLNFQEFLLSIDQWVSETSRAKESLKVERLKSSIISTLEDETSPLNHLPKIVAPFGAPLPIPQKLNRRRIQDLGIKHSRKHYSTVEVVTRKDYVQSLK